MELIQAINERRSIRGFKTDPVPQNVLRQVLKLAVRSVSANNAQPWEFAVVTGDVLDALRRSNQAALQEKQAEDYAGASLRGVYLDRSKALGKQLFSAMDIARDDRKSRSWWLARGFSFFDAPVLILLYMDKSLDETAFRFDMGCVTQNICLAAMEYGLGTCVEEQAITYQNGIREELHFPESKQLVCGIAIGYPDWTFPANNVVSTREAVDNITKWYGF